MFAGRRRRSSNIRVMQLFHELKQQFPTVPDHVVSAYIASHAHSNSSSKDSTIREILEAAAALDQQEPMGRSPPPCHEPPPTLTHPSSNDSEEATATTSTAERNEMNDSESDFNRNVVKSAGVTFSKKHESVSVCTARTTSKGRNSAVFAKRPDKLDIKPDSAEFSARHGLQPSEKCKDVYKLLNSDNVSEKPPRSPVTHKRLSNAPKNSPTRSQDGQTSRSPLASPEVSRRLPHDTEEREVKKKETASTPTQTTDTLLGGNSVNLSLNVNCSMDVVQSPTRRTSVLQVTPQPSWLQEPISPRSYTSVNLTLRPPSAEPQPPIDITSQNSSLTYSTSSFDSQKGLQSRLQITVGPGGGSVSSTRSRPRSYHTEGNPEGLVAYRAVSLNNLATTNEPPVILKQQARIERLKKELRSEKTKLELMQNEVAHLEGDHAKPTELKISAEVEKQLRRVIKHLQYQCEQLALETDKNVPADNHEDFYHNIYTGQRGPLNIEGGTRGRLPGGSRYNQPSPSGAAFQDEGPKWNCHLCTFLNHPDLDKCEQCEMPRILHGKSPSNPNITRNPQQTPYPINYHLVPSYSLPNFHDTSRGPVVINRPIGFLVDGDLSYVAQNLSSRPAQFTRPS